MLHRSRLVQVFFPLLKKKCQNAHASLTQPHALISCHGAGHQTQLLNRSGFICFPIGFKLFPSFGNLLAMGTLPGHCEFAKTTPWTSMHIFHIFLSFRILPYLIKPDSIYLFLWLLADFLSIPSLIFRVFTLFLVLP